MSERCVKTFYLLDFDRCLGDTVKLHSLLARMVEELTPITRAEMDEVYDQAIASAGSLDSVERVELLLKHHDSTIGWEVIEAAFFNHARHMDLLEPGARELLDYLQARSVPFGIVTYGGQRWQRTKLFAAGLADVPFVITNIRRKGKLIASWQNRDGQFELPASLALGDAIVAEHLVLVDDKAVSFETLPSHVGGYYVVWDDRPQLPTQMGVVPSVVKTVGNLREVIAAIA